MKMNKQIIGWIVAAVLLAALLGVLIFQNVGGGESREAAFGGQGRGQGPPPEVAADVNAILEEKNRAGKDSLPEMEPGDQAPTLGANPPQVCDPSLDPNVFAEWRNNPRNLNEAAGMADEILVGTVVSEASGQPFVADVPSEPGGKVETPVQNVTIRVDEAVKGSAREGAVVTIERLGDAQGCFRVEGDPPYQRGQQVLLLLEEGVGGRPSHAISPAGRYEIGLNRAVEAVDEHSPVAAEIAGQRLEQILARLKNR